ncbi:T9SS type A sorting domain-containing protein [Neolewinella antarctica]|uniref:Secretion system C-terminal sorting domain-containing protein n=1 Tax=Neolewinella antarctica TaxID=442734 RepID=A0ABX0XG72_9BACT|nr:T9SS type A sorting domain-containing protein [Neolewinella antarctica]NJC28231.1 hypothetical protein [Neolewinella antarctica]
MNYKNLLLLFALLSTTGALFAQNVLVIEGGSANPGSLELAINGDTTSTGERADPNRIYELKAGEFYIQRSAINVSNPTGTITIRGQEGGSKPIIFKQPVNDLNIGTNEINSSLTIQNIQYHNQESDNSIPETAFNISGNDRKLIVEESFFENCSLMIFNMNNVKQGANVEIRNSYFRDFHDFAQWWGGRVLMAKVPIDTFIFENNTVSGGGLTVLGQNCLFDYSVINHNTFINNRKYPFLNQYWREAYFTNNLFVNGNMVGEDRENVAVGGQDPDALLHGIIGVDTIENSIALPSRYLNTDSTLTDEIDELSDIIFYAADNVVVSSATLDDYYNGGFNSEFPDAPTSYLNWGGTNGAFKVVNVPGIWKNERTTALLDDHKNLVEENNIIYEFRAEDLGMVTEALPQEAADPFIQWNLNKWGVPGVETPTRPEYVKYQFGDFDPLTIPGVETESAAAGSGGITKISDVLEDFSYTRDLTSVSDGLRIGALHWNDEDYDAEASIKAVKDAYQKSLTSTQEVVSADNFNLSNAPNPFKNTTMISFDLKESTAVTLSIFDISGRAIQTLVSSSLPAGTHTAEFMSGTHPSGTYFYRLTTDKYVTSKTMILLK